MSSDDLLVHVSRRAMACEFEVQFPAQQYKQGTEWALESLDLVDAAEEQISYFRPASELSRVNLLAADEPVEVSSALFDLLRMAMALYEETDGAYDITATPLWEVWGFARRKGEAPTPAQLAEARSSVGSHLVELGADRRTVRFRQAGVRLNLGSIGKGYALDVCGQRLMTLGMADFLVHGGQSSVLARGNRGLQEGQSWPAHGRQECLHRAWEVGIRHPHQPGRRLGVIRLRDRALGTSGAQFQSFRHRGHRYGHILDPRSGWPADQILTSTVVASTAAMADALSTAFYVMGPERSLDYCRKHTDVGAILVCAGPRGEEVEIHTAGLSEEEYAAGN